MQVHNNPQGGGLKLNILLKHASLPILGFSKVPINDLFKKHDNFKSFNL